MNKNQIPNMLTLARFLLAVGSFYFMNRLVHSDGDTAVVLDASFIAFWLYLIAVSTDFLDGHIARKYGWVTSLGRIADPVVDKVLTLGGMMFLAAAPFLTRPEDFGEVMPVWAVVLVLTREFLVTAIRGYVESRGLEFPADPVGKWKMVCQSVYICVLLGGTAGIPEFIRFPLLGVVYEPWAVAGLFWAVFGMTIISGIHYCMRAMKMLQSVPS